MSLRCYVAKGDRSLVQVLGQEVIHILFPDFHLWQGSRDLWVVAGLADNLLRLVAVNAMRWYRLSDILERPRLPDEGLVVRRCLIRIGWQPVPAKIEVFKLDVKAVNFVFLFCTIFAFHVRCLIRFLRILDHLRNDFAQVFAAVVYVPHSVFWFLNFQL